MIPQIQYRTVDKLLIADTERIKKVTAWATLLTRLPPIFENCVKKVPLNTVGDWLKKRMDKLNPV